MKRGIGQRSHCFDICEFGTTSGVLTVIWRALFAKWIKIKQM